MTTFFHYIVQNKYYKNHQYRSLTMHSHLTKRQFGMAFFTGEFSSEEAQFVFSKETEENLKQDIFEIQLSEFDQEINYKIQLTSKFTKIAVNQINLLVNSQRLLTSVMHIDFTRLKILSVGHHLNSRTMCQQYLTNIEPILKLSAPELRELDLNHHMLTSNKVIRRLIFPKLVHLNIARNQLRDFHILNELAHVEEVQWLLSQVIYINNRSNILRQQIVQMQAYQRLHYNANIQTKLNQLIDQFGMNWNYNDPNNICGQNLSWLMKLSTSLSPLILTNYEGNIINKSSFEESLKRKYPGYNLYPLAQ